MNHEAIAKLLPRHRDLIRLLARTTRLPRGEWFGQLPDAAQNAWMAFEKLLDRAGADYIEQSDQRGGAVILVQDPPNLRGIAVHLFGPSAATRYDRKLRDDVPVKPAHLTVWDQTGDNDTLPMGRWKKGLNWVKKALGLEVDEPHGFHGLLQRVMSERRDVIAELLRADRRDLADVVAKTPAKPKPKKPKAKKPPDDDPVRSSTGRKLRDGLGHLPQFKGFEPDAWNHLGNHVKKYANTTVVFTGALSSLLLWAFEKGKLLPMTRRYGVEAAELGISKGVMKPGYSERYIDFLEDGGILEKTTGTTKQALKANHTKQDEVNAKERPRTRVSIYTAGEALPGILKLLAKYGAKAGAVASTEVRAGRRQTVYLGNTGPNGAREWVVVQYRNLPNGTGEKVVRVSSRQGSEPSPEQHIQWSDIPVMRAYLKNMRHKLSRCGVILLNKLR